MRLSSMQAPTHSLEILVTGASGGIGSAIVEELQKRHCHVIGTDRNDADMSSYEDIKHLALSALQEKLDWGVYAHGFIDIGCGCDGFAGLFWQVGFGST